MLGRRNRSSPETSPLLIVLTAVLAVAVISFCGYLVATFPPEADLTASDTASAGPDGGSAPPSAPGGSDSPPPPETPTPTATESDSESDGESDSGEPAPVPDRRITQVAVIGDGYTSGNEFGGRGAKAWPRLIEQRTDAVALTEAELATGYVVAPGRSTSFEERAAALPDQWDGGQQGDAVIVFGSRSDATASPEDVRAAALRTLTGLREAYPAVEVIAIGPVWPVQFPFPAGPPVAEAVRSAAQEAGVTYVDPQAEPWFSADDPTAIAPNEISPTNFGHGLIASKVRAVLVDAGIVAA